MKLTPSLLAGLLVATNASAGAAQDVLPEVFVEEDCPFECCQYGPWIAGAPVSLREAPTDESPVVANISPGDTVQAEGGEIRSIPRPMTMTSDYGDFGSGDTVWVLNDWRDTGRGIAIWSEGETSWHWLDILRAGEGLEPRRSTWWVRMRLKSGAVGWTNETEAMHGKDGCAVE